MLLTRLIATKRDGGRIAEGDWGPLMRAYAAGDVPDYQMAALVMACFLRGLDEGETLALMTAMLDSGRTLDLSHLAAPRVDKHSTGGVGDKVSIILAPLVAACGVAVPMMSGRGLGHTGGTLDKLESIPGFDVRLPLDRARAQVERLGCVLIGQTGEIAPADKKLYALRDATSTVEAIPLIAASIMSKKLAEGLTGLVLDVKTGSGAFIPETPRALDLARTMVRLGEGRGVRVHALLTSMHQPLGRACGNALEIAESVACLQGDWPEDLRTVTMALAVEMLLVAGVASDAAAAIAQLQRALDSGAALETLRQVIMAQGGDGRVCDDPASVLAAAPVVDAVAAPADGVVAEVAPRAVGEGIIALGGGRTRMEETVDPAVGFIMQVRPGDRVRAGDPLALVHARDAAGLAAGRQAILTAVRLGDETPVLPRLVSHRVTTAGVETLG